MEAEQLQLPLPYPSKRSFVNIIEHRVGYFCGNNEYIYVSPCE